MSTRGPLQLRVLRGLKHGSAKCVNNRALTVTELFVAKHGGDGVVADVVADAQSTQEQFDGQVLVDAVVQYHSLFLAGRQQQRHVAVWPMRERRQRHVSV